MQLKNYLGKKTFFTNWSILISGLMVLVIMLGSYYLGSSVGGQSTNPASQTPAGNLVRSTETALAETISSSTVTSTVGPDQVTDTPTPEILPGTDQATIASPTLESTSTTDSPTVTSTLAVIIKEPEDWARLVSVSPADGTYFAPKTIFTKVWTIRNIGKTAWTKDYDLVFFSGTSMTKVLVVPLSKKVLPGETIQLSISLTAPKDPGTYQGFWILRNSSGESFGIGDEADEGLKNRIIVLNVDPTNKYDFLLNYCQADWWNSQGQVIRCPGEPSQISGFVYLSTTPYLENGLSDRPVLWVHTDTKLEGIISGRYPTYLVENGDHFKAKVGCMSGYPSCNVTFQLLYKVGNEPAKYLGSWKELYGGGISTINVNLSSLAGQNVQFILRMISTNNYPASAQGFWMTPRIVYIAPSPTPTASPTPTETLEPTETPTDTPTP